MSKNDSTNKGMFSLESLLGFVSDNFVLIVIMLSFFLGGFFFGSLWTENKMLKNGGIAGSAPSAAAPSAAAPAAAQPGERDLSIAGLVAKAKEVGANANDVQKCIDSGETAPRVASDFEGGQAGGITGTPGTVIVVDGQPAELIPGALPYDQVKVLVDNYVNGGEIDPTKQAAVANMPAVTGDDHYKGAKNAKIVLVEYSDFECPFCERFHPTITQVVDENPNDVAWVFRNYPLSFHQNAQKSAEAAECVAKLEGNDTYWEYVDALFKTI